MSNRPVLALLCHEGRALALVNLEVHEREQGRGREQRLAVTMRFGEHIMSCDTCARATGMEVLTGRFRDDR